MNTTAETPYSTARRIVCEEWQQAVKEFGLTPNSVTEKVVGSIINRLDRTPWPALTAADSVSPDSAAVAAERERILRAVEAIDIYDGGRNHRAYPYNDKTAQQIKIETLAAIRKRDGS